MDFKVRLIPDDYHIYHVGKLAAGAQFWIDVQLRSEAESTRDFVATYVFDLDGVLIHNEIVDLGLRSESDRRVPAIVIDEQLARLGSFEKTDISVFPFSINAHGLTFGLVVRQPDPDEPEENGDEIGPLVDAFPGWTLMFYPPWDEGLYAT